MKKILTSSITDSAQLPLLKRTIDHLQEQELENAKSCVYASLGSSDDSVPIILWGYVGTLSTVTVSNDTLTVTEGAFIYDGEIYQISAQSITKTGANVFTLSLDTTTFQAGEPTIYSDGVTPGVYTNQNAKIQLSEGLTGTGICDWDNVLIMNKTIKDNSILGAGDIVDNWNITGATLTASGISLRKISKRIYIDASIVFTANVANPSFNFRLKSEFRKGNINQQTISYYPSTLYDSTSGFLTASVISHQDINVSISVPITLYTIGDSYFIIFSYSYETDTLLI